MTELQRVMYVEDEPDIRAVAKLALEAVGGLQVLVCEGGEQALQQGPAFAPQLILLDVMMPGLDGPATLAALRAEPSLASVPVVFMTAKVQPHEVAHFLGLGAVGVIAKPFDPMSLSDKVRGFWQQTVR